jgi:creatinine amidohydrolase
MQKKTQWHLMTWQEIREAQKQQPVVLIPAGTIETQGPYTFVGAEYLVPQRLAEAVARQTNSLVAPAIPFGDSSLFHDYPGTITLRPDVLSNVYEDVVRSIVRAGFNHLLFLAMHVPNQPLMEHVAHKIRNELGLMIAWINPGRLAPAIMKEVSPDYAAARGHGADPLLSLVSHLQPDMVDTSNAVPNKATMVYQGLPLEGMTPSFQGFPLNMAIRMQDVSPESGGFGDPTLASAEQGKAIFEAMVSHVSALVQQFGQMDTHV